MVSFTPVSLPQMVASSTMDAESVGLVKDYVNELFMYGFLCFRVLIFDNGPIAFLSMSAADCSWGSTRVPACSTRIYLDHNLSISPDNHTLTTA